MDNLFPFPDIELFLASPLNRFVMWTTLVLIAIGILLWPISYIVASYCVYHSTLHRKTPEQWSRDLPSTTEERHLKMDEEGMAWRDKNAAFITDVHIENNGLNLFGEYFDFGNDRCVIFLSGRTESLRYGYYFSRPYAESGYNVLLIDPRAHGLSEGEFNTVGFEESRDALAWAKYIHDTYHVKSIIFHGICIGAAGAMFALTAEDCPNYIDGMVAEGMFANFGESMKNHLRERKKPIFILYDLIDMWMGHYTGHSMNYGPIDVIGKMNKPLLMIHSKMDIYSTPAYAQKLYDTCPSDKKELVWYDRGEHSMLRYTDTEKYDTSIKEFIAKYFDASPLTAPSNIIHQ